MKLEKLMKKYPEIEKIVIDRVGDGLDMTLYYRGCGEPLSFSEFDQSSPLKKDLRKFARRI